MSFFVYDLPVGRHRDGQGVYGKRKDSLPSRLNPASKMSLTTARQMAPLAKLATIYLY